MNANQLRRWVLTHRQAQTLAGNDDMVASPSMFVPVVPIADPAPMPASMPSLRAQPEQQCPHDVTLRLHPLGERAAVRAQTQAAERSDAGRSTCTTKMMNGLVPMTLRSGRVTGGEKE